MEEKEFKLPRFENAAVADTLGFEKMISTQTEIVAGVIQTKYYELLGQNLSDFVPFDVGRGAYSTNIFQYTAGYVGDPFETGLVQPSTGLGINAKSNIMIDGLSIKNNYWRMDYEVSHEVVEMGKVNAQAFSIIEEQEKARKKVYDLGIQKVVFKGIPSNNIDGLLNMSNININTSLFPKKLSAMSIAELQALATGLLQAYLANNNSTQMPNRLCIPTSDFVALGTPFNPEFPVKTKREVLEQALREGGAVDLKIVHTTYNETASADGAHARYVLYRHDADALRMYVPKPYTPHALYPMNGIDFVSVAESQFSGVVAIRPAEMLYLDAQA